MPRPEQTVPSYVTLHQRLRKRNGPARNQTCRSCLGTARQWAYDHTDPNQLWDTIQDGRTPYQIPYSLDLDRYIPLCTFCHRWFDKLNLPYAPCEITGCDLIQTRTSGICGFHYSEMLSNPTPVKSNLQEDLLQPLRTWQERRADQSKGKSFRPRG